MAKWYEWSDKGANEGLKAGEKSDPSGDGVGHVWSRDDGSSGQSQTSRNDDDSVSHWQHDRGTDGRETISGVTYEADGSDTLFAKRVQLSLASQFGGVSNGPCPQLAPRPG